MKHGNGGAKRLSWQKNRGEQDEAHHNRGSHCRFEERTGTREISRDLSIRKTPTGNLNNGGEATFNALPL